MDEYERERQKLTEDFRESCESFTVLGDPHRQRIIMLMLESRCCGMSVQEITECVNLSRPAVSYHLKVLKQAGIVTMHRKGTSNLYCLDVESDVWHRFRDITTEVCSIIDRIRANGFRSYRRRNENGIDWHRRGDEEPPFGEKIPGQAA